MLSLLPNKKAQVFIEAALVIILLAVLAIAGMRLFANLNMNAIERLEKYRETRLAAVNSIVPYSTITDPESPHAYNDSRAFLYYSPNKILISDDSGSFGRFNAVLYDDPRMNEAELLLERFDSIVNIILPFKVNQAYYIVDPNTSRPDKLQLERKKTCFKSWGGREICITIGCAWEWIPKGYIEMAVDRTHSSGLIKESRDFSDEAYSIFGEAIQKFQEVLDQPQVPGPFDPDPDPAAYGMENTVENKNTLTKDHEQNRKNISDTITNLKDSRDTGINTLLNDEVKPNLNYVYNNLGVFDVHSFFGYCYVNDSDHRNAVSRIKTRLLAVSGDFHNNSIFTEEMANSLSSIYSLISSNSASYADVSLAKDLVSSLVLPSFQHSTMTVTYSPQLEEKIRGNKKLTEEEKNGIIDNLKKPKYDSLKISNMPSLKNVGERLNNYLIYSIKYWDKENNAADEDLKEGYRSSRKFFFALARNASWTLYRITDIRKIPDGTLALR